MRDNCSCDLYNRSLCDLPAVCQAGKCGKISLDMKKKNMHVKKGMILSKQSSFWMICRVKHVKLLV